MEAIQILTLKEILALPGKFLTALKRRDSTGAINNHVFSINHGFAVKHNDLHRVWIQSFFDRTPKTLVCGKWVNEVELLEILNEREYDEACEPISPEDEEERLQKLQRKLRKEV